MNFKFRVPCTLFLISCFAVPAGHCVCLAGCRTHLCGMAQCVSTGVSVHSCTHWGHSSMSSWLYAMLCHSWLYVCTLVCAWVHVCLCVSRIIECPGREESYRDHGQSPNPDPPQESHHGPESIIQTILEFSLALWALLWGACSHAQPFSGCICFKRKLEMGFCWAKTHPQNTNILFVLSKLNYGAAISLWLSPF